VPAYNPQNLPKQTHALFLAQAREVVFTYATGARERLAKEYGIKGIPILSYLSTISFPDSFPHGFMHLLWENIIKNLFMLWFGDFNSLNTGTGNYQMLPDDIKAAGAKSAAAGSWSPYAFGMHPCHALCRCRSHT
jgi:hypothetical protein